jgi:hypothetical protein
VRDALKNGGRHAHEIEIMENGKERIAVTTEHLPTLLE